MVGSVGLGSVFSDHPEEEYLRTFASLRCSFHSLKTFSQVSEVILVLVFASQVGRLLFWQRRKSITVVISLKGSWEMKWFSKSPWLNTAITATKALNALRWLASFYYLFYFLGFHWLKQSILYFLNLAIFKGKSYPKLFKLILNWTILKY